MEDGCKMMCFERRVCARIVCISSCKPPEGEGIFLDGVSLSTQVAIVCSRSVYIYASKERGKNYRWICFVFVVEGQKTSF